MGSPTTEISKNCVVQKIHAKVSICLIACCFGISVSVVLSTLHPQKSVGYVKKPGAIWVGSKYCSERVHGGLDKSSAWGEHPCSTMRSRTPLLVLAGRVVRTSFLCPYLRLSRCFLVLLDRQNGVWQGEIVTPISLMSRLRHIKIDLCDHQTNLSELEQCLTKSVSQFSCHSLCFHLSHPLCIVSWQEPGGQVGWWGGEMEKCPSWSFVLSSLFCSCCLLWLQYLLWTASFQSHKLNM